MSIRPASPPLGSPSDGDRVVDALVDAHRAFLPQLVRRCERIVGDRAAAEDLAQDAFVRAYERRAELEPGRPVEAWLTTVATRMALDALRQRRRRLVEHLVGDVPASDLTFDDVSRRDAHRRLACALDTLPERHRRALTMFGIDGLSYEEIAESEGVSVSAVKMTLHRARHRLRAAVRPGDLFGSLPITALMRNWRAWSDRRAPRMSRRRAGAAAQFPLSAAVPGIVGLLVGVAVLGGAGDVSSVRTTGGGDRSTSASADARPPQGQSASPAGPGAEGAERSPMFVTGAWRARLEPGAESARSARPRTVCLRVRLAVDSQPVVGDESADVTSAPTTLPGFETPRLTPPPSSTTTTLPHSPSPPAGGTDREAEVSGAPATPDLAWGVRLPGSSRPSAGSPRAGDGTHCAA